MKFEFEKLALEFPESVYFPAEDSLLLAETIKELELKEKTVLEIGCGSGLIALLCASKGAIVTAVDISEEAVNATRQNAKLNKLELGVFVSDLFEKANGKFDLIIFNAPYLPVEKNEKTSRVYDGGLSGRKVIEKFILQCKNHLNKNGKVLLVVSSLTNPKKTIKFFERNDFNARIIAKKKVFFEELIVLEASRV